MGRGVSIRDQATRLQAAVDAVMDAHGVPARRRSVIANHPVWEDYGALGRAKTVADVHAYHNGTWELGSCDGELFALEWAIYDIEHPAPRRNP